MREPAHLLHVLPPRLALMAGYLTALHVVAQYYVVPVFGYLGYTYRTPEPVTHAVVIALVLALTGVMPRHLGRPSQFVLWMQFVLAVVPSMVVPQFTEDVHPGAAFEFAVVVGLLWLVVLALVSEPVIAAVRRVRPAATPSVQPSAARSRRWTAELVVASLLASMVIAALFGVSAGLAGVTEVRSVRMAYREALTVLPPGTAYVLLATSNVLNPLALMRSLLERRWALAAVPLLGQLLIYSVGGHRMVLMSIPGVVVMWLWMRGRPRPSGTAFLAWVSGGLIAATTAALALGSGAAGLLALRMFVEPGSLTAAYLGLFSDRDHLYWSYSFLSWLVDYPYDLTPNFLVGAVARGDSAVSANVNLFGDGYMAWGWIGMAVESLLLVALVLMIDGPGRDVGAAECCAVLLLPSFALANSNVFTAVLTHGFLFAWVLLILTARAGPATPARPRTQSEGKNEHREQDGERGGLEQGAPEAARRA